MQWMEVDTIKKSSSEARSSEASSMGWSGATLRQFEVKTNVFGKEKNEKLRIISSSTKGINELMCIRSPSPPEAIKCRGNFGDKNWPDGINYLFIYFLRLRSLDWSSSLFSLSSVVFKKNLKRLFVVFIQSLAALWNAITPKTIFDHKISSTDNAFCCRFCCFVSFF